MEIQQSSPSCAPLTWCLCGGPPLKLCLLKTLALHSHALLYGHTSVGQIRALLSLSAWRGGGGIRSESPPSRQPHLAHLLVSPALPGHSSQPLSNRRAGERMQGGWEVLRGLKRTWNGEQSTSSSYMSDCNRWTCCSWSLCPAPVFSQCM